MRAGVPPYFDLLIDGFRSARTGRHVHLGYWEQPPALSVPCPPDEFEAAQARLNEIMIKLARIEDGQSVLDVGCGFGGTLAAVNEGWRDMQLVGLNIDRRQLDICRTIAPRPTNALALVMADACALPFRNGALDRLVCLEAMFHFRSRAEFLRGAADALRPAGRLALSDIVFKHPGGRAPVPVGLLEDTIRREYGPWPELWAGPQEILDRARAAGLALEEMIDVTRETLPTYRVTAPDDESLSPRLSAGSLMRWLHRNGYLTYICLALRKA